MKKWLNNPIVVAALALAAVYSVYEQVSPLLGGSAAYSEEPEVIAPMDQEPGFSGTITPSHSTVPVQKTNRSGLSEHRADLAQASKPGMARRDPFHRAAQTKQVVVKSAIKQSDRIDKTTSARLPTLSAVIAGPKSRYAVIDTKIVEIGSVLGRYTVKEINGSSVSLIGPGGQRTLTLKPDRQGERHE